MYRALRSSSTTAGAGTGSSPCALLTVPLPRATGARPDRGDVEQLEGQASPDHIDQGVQPAYLVKVDVLRRYAMEATLGRG